MASSITEQFTRFYVDTLTTTPVLLSESVEGQDYILMRMITESATIAIRDMVGIEDDDLREVELSGAEETFPGIVPDTVFNRKQVEANNAGSDWSYDLLFADGAEIDVIFPITAIICSVEIAQNQAITASSPLTTDAAGHFELAAAGDDYCGRALAIIATGTGNQIIAAVLFGFTIIHD